MEPNLTGVSFKAYLKGGDADAEVRRFNVDKEVSTSLAYLQGKLVSIFPRLRRDNYAITWMDAEGDEVVVGSDEELVIALTEMKGPVYKIAVTIKPKGSSDDVSSSTAPQGQLHMGVTCDGCEGEIYGYRYKCAVCPDYDLCSRCESKGNVHPGHNMVRIADPGQAWPHHFFRRLSKMHERSASRRAHSAAHAAAAANVAAHEAAHAAAHADAVGGGGDATKSTFYQSAFDPFQNGGHWVHGMRGGGGCRGGGRGGGGMRGRPPFAFGRCGGGKMWEAMMKGWTGEEEMKARRESKYGPEDKGENKKENEDKKENEGEPVTSPFEDILTNLASGGGTEYLRNVGNLVAAALDPLGVDVQVDIEHNGKRTNVTQENKDEDDDKAKKGECKADGGDKEEVGEAEEAKEEDKKSLDSDDNKSVEGEDWTVVGKTNKEEENENDDSGVINIPVQVEQAKKEEEEAVVDEKPESVREVPINVSDKPAEVLFAAPDGTLYPELPKQEASKVNEEEVAKGEKEKPKKKDDDDGQAKPSAPAAQVSHPDPKIQVALQAMTNMGFSNDGGWLTQLLEAKGGDIGKVLDVLQPVRPVRD